MYYNRLKNGDTRDRYRSELLELVTTLFSLIVVDFLKNLKSMYNLHSKNDSERDSVDLFIIEKLKNFARKNLMGSY